MNLPDFVEAMKLFYGPSTVKQGVPLLRAAIGDDASPGMTATTYEDLLRKLGAIALLIVSQRKFDLMGDVIELWQGIARVYGHPQPLHLAAAAVEELLQNTRNAPRSLLCPNCSGWLAELAFVREGVVVPTGFAVGEIRQGIGACTQCHAFLLVVGDGDARLATADEVKAQSDFAADVEQLRPARH